MTFDRLLDDAALFPPGNAAMPAAVRAHLERRGGPDGRYVGPFVCPAARLAELAAELDGERIEVAVVGVPPSDLPSGVTVVAIEVADAAPPVLPDGVTLVVERPWGSGFDVPAGAVLKLRCGGAYVPTVEDLAAAIRHCVDADQPFKLTAGLHHAVRSGDAHGFVNVMAAVTAALAGKDPSVPLAATEVEALDLDGLEASRELFRSIGTCSITEPLVDLRALGLLP